MTEPPSLVVVEHDPEHAVATVTLNRPKRLNALSEPLVSALLVALGELDDDEAVRCIVLTGSEKAFAAGADIAELASTSAIGMLEARRRDRWQELRALRTPTVAAVCGYCLGGGCELAMCCDLIVASETAQFGQPETALGLLPGAGGTQRLTHAVGKALAMDVILSGRRLTAQEALAAGLVARVQPVETWLEDAKTLAAEIAARGPFANRLAKEAVNRAYEGPLSLGLDYERRLLCLALASEDAKEGLNAFLEKRPPRFAGR
jgi:enoyl-CoA hydratase